MYTTRRTSSLHGQAPSALDRATRWWETPYTSVTWDYPPSPAAHRDALLSCGASHSRFLRIAYLSTRDPTTCSPIVSSSPSTTSTSPSTFPPPNPTVHVPPTPRPSAMPRSTNPTSHLKRRHSHWPKPPHYHASLLRTPLSRRKGLFRAVLAPNQAVDFFRRDVLVVGATVSMSAPGLNQRDPKGRRCHMDACACASVHGVAESVLESYEAAAGFSGWHGLGIDVMRCVERESDDEDCWDEREARCRKEKSAGKKRSSDLGLEMDEVQVEEGRTRWALVAQDLVGPPGVVLRWVVENAKSNLGVQAPSSTSWRAEEIQWDPDIGSSRSPPSKLPSDSNEKRPPPPSSSRPEIRLDSPPAWWYGPPPHRRPPTTHHMHSFRFPPPPPVQYGVPSLQFPPWLPNGRVTSAQGHGYWYSPQPIGAPSPTSRNPNQAKAFAPHSHVVASPTSAHSAHSPRYPTRPNVGRDEHEWALDCDKETETDHGYESATTTTDSDPPPHTPIGTTTTPHRVEGLQVHGDNDGKAHSVEIDADRVAACETLHPSDPSTPVKVRGQLSSSISSSMSPSGELGPNRDGRESSKAAVVFPSLNGSFRQGSLHISVSPSAQGVSAQTTPVRTLTPVSPSSHLSTKESTIHSGVGEQDSHKTKLGSGGLEPSGSGDGFSSPPTISSPGLEKHSQGFWESMTSISPCLSSSSPPLSPSVSKPAPGWIDERTSPVPEESHESSSSSEAASSQFTPSAKSRSMSPCPRRVTSAGSTRSSSSHPASYSSPTSTPASGSYPSSPSPLNGSSSFVPPLAPAPTLSNPTALLPAFLTTTSAKRKKMSRTREIVDRLRSSSVDMGKCGVLGLDGIGWLVGGELDGMKHGKTVSSSGSESVGVGHGDGEQTSPLQSDVNAAGVAGSGLDVDKNHHGQDPESSSCESSSSGSGGNHDRKAPGSETVFSLASACSKGVITTTTAANTGVTPFPILSVSQTSPGGTCNHNRTRVSPDGTDGPKTNAISPKGACSSGPHSRFQVGAPNSGTSPPKHSSHHPLPSVPASHPHPAVHPHPVAPPPPPPMITTVPPFQPVYVSFPQYHVMPAPPPVPVPVSPVHQGPQGQLQGTWVAVYPARPPPHVAVHPLSAPITGVSGMRHASW